MQALVSLLERTWARLGDFLNFESLNAAFAGHGAVLSEGPVREGLAVGLAVFVAVMLIGRRRAPVQRDEIELLRERLREAELKLEAARGEIATARRVQDDLHKGDPQVFAAALATAIAEDSPKARGLDPEAWLGPLRPALADAYLKQARAILGKARSEDDLKRARALALGAAAAEPERRECAGLLARIDEAERLGLFSEMSEAESLAWRIARREAEALGDRESRGLVARSHGQIGYSVLLAGWEAEELHAAALAELTGRGVDLGDEWLRETAAAATRAAPRRTARAAAEAPVEEACVVALNGAMVQEAEGEARMAGAGRGSTVLMMPRGRGAGRAALGPDGRGRGSADAGCGDRETEFRRLWERRRRPDMLGETHPRTLAARANMAYEAARKGRLAEAEAILREVIEAMSNAEASGDHRQEALTVQHNLGFVLLRQGRLDEAEEMFSAVMGDRDEAEVAPLAWAAAHGLGEVRSAQGDHAGAEKAFGAVWKARSADARFGPDHPHTLWSRVRMLREAAATRPAAG